MANGIVNRRMPLVRILVVTTDADGGFVALVQKANAIASS
jgi:hypothetical protein